MDQPIKWFEDCRFIAAIRSGSADDAEEMIKASRIGGFRLFEISMQTPQALRLIESYASDGNILVGAGTVTDGEMAQKAINAGAKFLSSCYTDRDVISVAKNNDSLVIQSVVTSTEAVNAHQMGADLIQIYPVSLIGGVDYVRSLRSPLPFLKLVAAGGVTIENAFDYLKYCVAVSVDKALFDKPLVRNDNWNEMTDRAKQFTQKLESLKVSK